MVQGRFSTELHPQADLTLPSGYTEAVALEDASQVVIAARRSFTSLFFPDDRVWHFDGQGRFVRALASGLHFRCTRDSRLRVATLTHQDGHRMFLRSEDSPVSGEEAIAALHQQVREILPKLSACQLIAIRGKITDPVSWALAKLQPIAHWTQKRLAQDRDAFNRIYRPISILPPDQYAALVIQVTEGCQYNRCGFCDFYQDVPFRIKPLEELKTHVQAVAAYYGKGLGRYSRVFLGQANALAAESEHLLEAMRMITVAFPMLTQGMYAFVDAFHQIKTPEEYQRIAQAGMKRIYLGLETGSHALLSVLGKPGSAEDAVSLVRAAKDGGLVVAPVVLVGAGGKEWHARHVRRTLDVIARMGLGQKDQVYLSRLRVREGAYAEKVQTGDITPLSMDEEDQQADAFKKGIQCMPLPLPMVAPYDVRRMSEW